MYSCRNTSFKVKVPLKKCWLCHDNMGHLSEIGSKNLYLFIMSCLHPSSWSLVSLARVRETAWPLDGLSLKNVGHGHYHCSLMPFLKSFYSRFTALESRFYTRSLSVLGLFCVPHFRLSRWKSRDYEYTESETERVHLAGKAIGTYSKAAEHFYFYRPSNSTI